jgi:hypothetical protein
VRRKRTNCTTTKIVVTHATKELTLAAIPLATCAQGTSASAPLISCRMQEPVVPALEVTKRGPLASPWEGGSGPSPERKT